MSFPNMNAQRHSFTGLFLPPDAWLYRPLIPSCQSRSDGIWRVWNVAMWTWHMPRKNPFNSICRHTNVLHREHLPRIRRRRISENATATKFSPQHRSEPVWKVWLLFRLTGKNTKKKNKKKNGVTISLEASGTASKGKTRKEITSKHPSIILNFFLI